MRLNMVIAAVLLSALWALCALLFLLFRALKSGHVPFQAPHQGSPLKGLLFAFGKGMTPWEKESAGNHLGTYLTGILYHMAIFFGLLRLLWSLTTVPFPLPTPSAAFLLIGSLAGLGLLVKRLLTPGLRSVSRFDDWFSNLSVDLFLLLGALATLSPSLTLPFHLSAILLFLTLPLGKIRHCFFFFAARTFLGLFFGRRGSFQKRPL